MVQSQGNDAYKRGVQLRKKYFILEAVECYSRGLEVPPESTSLKSMLHSNRAQAHLKLSNNRKALEDSLVAIKLDQSASKACHF